MASTTLKVDGLDLSSYTAWSERNADVSNPERFTPQFGGNLALNDGQPWTRDSAGNKQWGIPLLLNAASTDALHTLCQTINSHLNQGAQVEFKPAGATNSTYFDLERGKLDEHWDFYVDTAGYLQATLTLWTRPYGHTGTTQLVGSALGTGVVQFSASVGGDIPAVSALELRIGSYQPVPFAAMYGISRSASYIAQHPAASLTPFVVAASPLIGASGAIASQFRSISVAVGGTTRIDDFLNPIGAYLGQRIRPLIFYQHRVFPATGLIISGQYVSFSLDTQAMATALGTTVASAGWCVVDLGEFGTPLPATGRAPVATGSLQMTFAVDAAASVVASPAVRLGGVFMLPVDISAGMVIGTGGVLIFDGAANQSEVLRWEGDRTDGETLYRGNASTYLDSLIRFQRGGAPRIPPTPSSAASGAPQFCALVTSLKDARGNDPALVSLAARARFSYLR